MSQCRSTSGGLCIAVIQADLLSCMSAKVRQCWFLLDARCSYERISTLLGRSLHYSGGGAAGWPASAVTASLQSACSRQGAGPGALPAPSTQTRTATPAPKHPWSLRPPRAEPWPRCRWTAGSPTRFSRFIQRSVKPCTAAGLTAAPDRNSLLCEEALADPACLSIGIWRHIWKPVLSPENLFEQRLCRRRSLPPRMKS